MTALDRPITMRRSAAEVVSDAGRLRRRTRRWTGSTRVAWVTLACALMVVLVDAWWPMPTWLRVGVVSMGMAAVAWATIMVLVRAAEAMFATARDLETSSGVETNPLINALQLHAEDVGVGGSLVGRALQRGAVAAAGMDARAIVNRRGLRRERLTLIVVAAAWLIVLILQPRLLLGGLARLVSPYGDHPPYSPTEFDVTVQPDVVYEGDDATVHVALDGKMMDAVDLVQLDAEGGELRRLPMKKAAAGRFERTLVDMREPMDFHVAAATGRSHRHRIDPQARSQPVEMTGAAEQGESGESDTASPRQQAADQLQQLIDRIGELLQQAAGAQLPGSVFDWQKWMQDAQAVGAACEALAEQLKPFNITALADADECPGEAATPSDVGDWLNRVAKAAGKAIGHLGQSSMPSASGETSRGDAQPQALIDVDPLTTGQSLETIQLPGVDPGQIRAMIEQAPRPYRRLVADYFRQLAHPPDETTAAPEAERP